MGAGGRAVPLLLGTMDYVGGTEAIAIDATRMLTVYDAEY